MEPSQAAWDLLGEAVQDILADMKRCMELGLHEAAEANGQTPAAFSRASPGAEVISLDEVRQRRLVRRRFAHGLLNAYELVDDEKAVA